VKRLTTLFKQLLTALEIILYIQLKREIGCHFLISDALPFFGMSFIIADLKVRVRVIKFDIVGLATGAFFAQKSSTIAL
jgi:hypothetical protein